MLLLRKRFLLVACVNMLSETEIFCPVHSLVNLKNIIGVSLRNRNYGIRI
jgi:hypothetical protein